MIGLFGAMYLLGMVIGCATLTRLGDLVGRKPVFLGGMIGNTVSILVLIVSKNPWVDFAMLFFFGLACAARYFVGFTYTLEFMP